MVIGADRTSMRYCSRRPDDSVLRVRLRELAAARRRFGYRRLHVLLRREGAQVNHKRLRPLYRDERLQVRRRQLTARNLCQALRSRDATGRTLRSIRASRPVPLRHRARWAQIIDRHYSSPIRKGLRSFHRNRQAQLALRQNGVTEWPKETVHQRGWLFAWH